MLTSSTTLSRIGDCDAIILTGRMTMASVHAMEREISRFSHARSARINGAPVSARDLLSRAKHSP